METSYCIKCQRPLTLDEIGLHKKLYNRASTTFMCIDCSSAYLDVPVDMLQKKIAQFKAAGCTYFPKE